MAVTTTHLVLEELPESSFRRVLSPKSPQIVLHQLPDTNRLGRRPRAHWLARLVHARPVRARAHEHALEIRREVPFVCDTSVGTRTHCVPRSFRTVTPNSQSLFSFSMVLKTVSSNVYFFLFTLSLFLVFSLHVLPFNSIYILFAYCLTSLTRM